MSDLPEQHFFEYNKTKVAYNKIGTGNKVLLTFHGFGQNSKNFLPIAYALKDTHTVYNFDLFFHGKSEWNETEKPLEKEFWKQLMSIIFKEEQIETCTLAGYSMGGKFALATCESFPERIEKLILIAPDGIKRSFWYTLATYPFLTRRIFKHLIHNPSFFQMLVKIVSKMNLLDKGVLKFVSSQMNTEDKRKKVYYSWVIFRNLKFDVKKISSLINEHDIKVEVFLGKWDKMFTADDLKSFKEKVKSYNSITLHSGHNTLIEEVGKYFKENNHV